MLPPASLKPNPLRSGAALRLRALALVCWKWDRCGYCGERTPRQGHICAQLSSLLPGSSLPPALSCPRGLHFMFALSLGAERPEHARVPPGANALLLRPSRGPQVT